MMDITRLWKSPKLWANTLDKRTVVLYNSIKRFSEPENCATIAGWRLSTVSIIDTLSAGFDRVTRRLWLIIVPVLLNAGIWMGPKLSIKKLSKQALIGLPSVPELGSQYQQSMEILQNWLADLGTEMNVLSMLSMRALGLPSVTGALASEARLFGGAQRIIEIESWPALIGTVLTFVLLSLLIGCFCLSLIAQEARDEPPDMACALKVAWRSWVRMVRLALVTLLAVAMMVVGMSVVSSVLALLSPGFAWLVLNLCVLGTLWLSVYASITFFFAPRAIVLDDMGVLHSLWSSFNVVHRSFLPAVGFILLVNVIQTGLLYIWRALAVNAVGTVISIVGNAYVGAGLALASFIFYRDRFVAWQKASAQAQPGEGRQ